MTDRPAPKHILIHDEIAAAILFLAGDSASMITGHTLPVDGGWVAR